MHAYRDQYAQLFHDGRNVVLIAISVDAADTLAAWARDDEFQYLFASDTGGVIGKTYGATNPKYGLDNRTFSRSASITRSFSNCTSMICSICSSDIVVFHQLSLEQIEQIIEVQLEKLRVMLAEREIQLELDESAK